MLTSIFRRIISIALSGLLAGMLPGCSTTGALTEAPATGIDSGLAARMDQLKVGSTRRSATFAIMGKVADRNANESGQAVDYYSFEQAANTVNPLIAIKSVLSNSYGTITECRLSFDRRDILSTRSCSMRQAGLTGDGVPRMVYPNRVEQAPQPEAAHPSRAASAPTKASCSSGETLLVIKSKKKQKDKSLEVTYRNSTGVGHIPPEAGALYKELDHKKPGDTVCLDTSAD